LYAPAGDRHLGSDSGFDAVHRRLDRLEQEYEMLKAGVARIEAGDREALAAELNGRFHPP